MYRIRLHGRGGQGMKTASRILGTAFFIEGYEVQDAPRYGAERRGAPIFAYVRAIKDQQIHERGIIQHPDLIIVADDTLVPVPTAGVITGLTDRSIVLINSKEDADVWQKRLNINSSIITLPALDIKDLTEVRFIGATCAGAAARLLGVISKASLEEAIRQELYELPEAQIQTNIEKAFNAYMEMAAHENIVNEGDVITAQDFVEPEWINMPFEDASISAPVIFSGASSVKIRTGLWRTLRPIIDYDKCRHCWWVCSTFCPDSAINIVKGVPEIDYDHCKGCMICVAQCPPHAIGAIEETIAQKNDQAETKSAGKETS